MSNKYIYVKESLAKKKEWMDTLKSAPCSRCKEKFPPYCMEWHHRDRKTKKFGVGRGGWRNSRKLILEEIAKCDLYCSNCHKIVEHEIRERDGGEKSC